MKDGVNVARARLLREMMLGRGCGRVSAEFGGVCWREGFTTTPLQGAGGHKEILHNPLFRGQANTKKTFVTSFVFFVV